MTRTKLYSNFLTDITANEDSFFLDCEEESGRQNLRMLKKNHDFIGAIYFVCIFSLRHFWFVDGLFRYRIMYCLDLLF